MAFEFETLGTYVVNYNAGATRTDNTPHSASANYTFHVGPISELAVMDSGEGSPLAAAGQTAYTIHAANNGPDAAPAVLVTLTGVPEGAEAITLDGTYRETSCANGVCQAEWDLGRLPVSLSRPAGGQLPFPTLTFIPPAGAPAPDIQATIANTQRYSVVIDGATHSTHYFDYIEENNTATIMARAGAGGTPPGTPQDLQGSFFLQPSAAVVRWGEVDSLNGWPVSHYQVWKFEDEPGAVCQTPRVDQDGAEVEGTLYLDSRYVEDSRTCYYVRAVNTRGVPGYWSEAVTATSEGLDQPRLTLEAGPAVGEGETATFTVRASPAPVAGDTLVVNYTVTQQGGYAAAGDLGQKDDVTIDNRGRATITVPTQSDDMDRPDGEVTVTLEDGFGYTLGTPRTASVAVLDDDNPTVSFAASPTEPLSEGLQPGTHYVIVNLDPPSHKALDIYYTLGGDVGDEGQRFRMPGSGRERSVTAGAGAASVTIPVQLVNRPDSREDTVLNLFLSPRHYYDLGSPSSYTLTIIEDDGPRAEFDEVESEVDEAGTTHNVVVNLSTSPDPGETVTINFSFGGSTATRDADYSIAGVTGSTGSVSANAGDTSVTIPLTIMGDNDIEGDETVILTLRSGPDYTLGDDRRHTVTIRDDDLPRASFDAGTSNPGEGRGIHRVRVNLSPPAPRGGLTLRHDVAGASTATRNRDYLVENTTFAQGGASSVDIWVDITDDGDNEPDETVVLTLRAGTGYAVDDPGEHTVTIRDDDPVLVAFAAAEASVSEAAGTHRARILVEPAPHEDITVNYSVGGTATRGAEDDFTIVNSGTATVRRGQGWVDVPVGINNDDLNEGDETVVLTLTGCGDGCDLALPVRHELTINDDDAPVASFAEAAVSVIEDEAGDRTVRVNLDRPASSAFTLRFGVASPPNIGAGGMDYEVPDPMEARVDVGRDYVDIPVTIKADDLNEADERLVLTLEPGRGYSVGSTDEYTLTIVDDDNDENTPVARFSSASGQIYEDHGVQFPTVLLPAPLSESLDVIVEYVGGTATLGEDFCIVPHDRGARRWPDDPLCPDATNDAIDPDNLPPTEAGDTFTVHAPANVVHRDSWVWARLTISPIDDGKAEGSETVIFRLLNGPGYTIDRGFSDLTYTILNAP